MIPVTPPTDPEITVRAASVLELWLKLLGALGMLWAFLEKVAKPYFKWRRDAQARVMREILAPELAQLQKFAEQEDGCARRLEVVLRHLQELFGDHDNLYLVAMDNRDRIDETNELLDSMGFSSSPRHPDRAAYIAEVVQQLGERRKRRRRSTDPTP